MTTNFAFQPFAQQMRGFQSALAGRTAAAAAGTDGPKPDTLPTTQAGNKITTRTPGGYTIEQTAGTYGEMVVTAPDGSTVRDWGDPHVATKTGAGAQETEQFTYKNDSTLVLGDGTKISKHTVPGPNDQTLLGGVTITNGNNTLQTSGLSEGKAQMSRNELGGLTDALTDDGMRVHMGGGARLTGDNGEVVDQAYVDANDTGSPWGHIDEMTRYISSGKPFSW